MKRAILVLFATLLNIIAFAQETGADINVDINKGGGGGSPVAPWMWVVGGAVFVLLLVALLRGRGSRS
ncbi:hypothetical protein [Adhaeribacter aquaticus]|uniref:hypothetical protein n=1 Tax=Adhaeribacter aquaticus TaxID=299567 RepID=UPI0004218C80|nr:hypothetical protein [Adhaeribacter aquaticus]